MLFWAYTYVLGILRERNRDIIGISRGILLLYPSFKLPKRISDHVPRVRHLELKSKIRDGQGQEENRKRMRSFCDEAMLLRRRDGLSAKRPIQLVPCSPPSTLYTVADNFALIITKTGCLSTNIHVSKYYWRSPNLYSNEVRV